MTRYKYLHPGAYFTMNEIGNPKMVKVVGIEN